MTTNLWDIIDADIHSGKPTQGVEAYREQQMNRSIVRNMLLEIFGREVIPRDTNHPRLFYISEINMHVYLDIIEGTERYGILFGYLQNGDAVPLRRPSDFVDCVAIEGLPATTRDNAF